MLEVLRSAFENRPGEGPLISFGLPFTQAVLKHVGASGASRVYLICSGSLAKNTSVLDELKTELRDSGRLAGMRVGMRPHTLWSEIVEIVVDARQCNADLLVTVGSGTLTDAAKVISMALANQVSTVSDLGSLSVDSPTYRGEDNIKPTTVDVVCVPTSLSGGEYSALAGATSDVDKRKYGFYRPGLKAPSLVILDPQLTTTTPQWLWLSTGVRALDHCVETLCSMQGDEAADQTAAKGLERLTGSLLRTKHDWEDLDARLQCQLAVPHSMEPITRGIPLGASHGIGHQLGPMGVPHGVTSCILSPAVQRYNWEKGANRERQNAVATLLWKDRQASSIFSSAGLKPRTAGLADLLDAIIRALGMPRTLSHYDVGEDKLDIIAEHSLQDRWVQTNPAPLDKDAVLLILGEVLA